MGGTMLVLMEEDRVLGTTPLSSNAPEEFR